MENNKTIYAWYRTASENGRYDIRGIETSLVAASASVYARQRLRLSKEPSNAEEAERQLFYFSPPTWPIQLYITVIFPIMLVDL